MYPRGGTCYSVFCGSLAVHTTADIGEHLWWRNKLRFCVIKRLAENNYGLQHESPTRRYTKHGDKRILVVALAICTDFYTWFCAISRQVSAPTKLALFNLCQRVALHPSLVCKKTCCQSQLRCLYLQTSQDVCKHTIMSKTKKSYKLKRNCAILSLKCKLLRCALVFMRPWQNKNLSMSLIAPMLIRRMLAAASIAARLSSLNLCFFADAFIAAESVTVCPYREISLLFTALMLGAWG